MRQVEQPDGSARFGMLETIREFGLEQLEAQGEIAETGRRHELYYIALAEHAREELLGHQQRERLTVLDAEYDNLRAVLSATLERGDGAMALRIAVAIDEFWFSRRYDQEALRWLTRALATASNCPPALRIRALIDVSEFAREMGDFATAESATTQALALSRESNDMVLQAVALGSAGGLSVYQGRYDEANGWFEQALRIARLSGNDHLLADALASRSLGLAAVCEYELGRTLAEESFTLRHAAGDRRDISHICGYLGYFALWQGNVTAAESWGQQSLAVAEEIEDRGAAFASELLGFVALERGDLNQAGTLFRTTIAFTDQHRSFMTIAETLEGLAGVSGGYGDVVRAATLLGAAEAIRERVGSPVPPPRQDRYDRTLAVVRARFDDALARAWAIGRAKSIDEVIIFALEPDSAASIEPVSEPESVISKRELDVLKLLVDGQSNQEIATALFISPHTAANHVASIMNKLGVDSRTAAATWAVKQGII